MPNRVVRVFLLKGLLVHVTVVVVMWSWQAQGAPSCSILKTKCRNRSAQL